MSWKCPSVCSVFLQLCSCFWDAQVIFLWKNSIIAWVVWLHVKSKKSKVYTCTFIFLFAKSVLLATISDQPSLCKINNLPLHLLRCRFYIMWNSICYYTRIVCVPAYAFEQARIRCFFFFVNILSPPSGLLATCN